MACLINACLQLRVVVPVMALPSERVFGTELDGANCVGSMDCTMSLIASNTCTQGPRQIGIPCTNSQIETRYGHADPQLTCL